MKMPRSFTWCLPSRAPLGGRDLVQVGAGRVDRDERGEVGERQPHERLGAQLGPRDRLGGDHVRAEQCRGPADGREVYAPGLGEGGADASAQREPLPIAATIPARSSAGVEASMRLAVVGPTEPAG